MRAGTFIPKSPYLAALSIPPIPFRSDGRQIWTARRDRPCLCSCPLIVVSIIKIIMAEEFSKRKARSEFHRPPPWAPENAVFFITINCQKRGMPQLTIPETSQGLLDACRFYQDQGKWHVSLCLLMPDHLHALISFNNDTGLGMGNLIKSWKRYTAKTFRVDWQRDYFDHRIRSESDMADKWIYIRENPVRAGLVESHEKWPYVLRGDGTRGW